MRVNEPSTPDIYVFKVADGPKQGLQFITAKSRRQAEHRVRCEIVEYLGMIDEFVDGLRRDVPERNVFLKSNSPRAVGWQWW